MPEWFGARLLQPMARPASKARRLRRTGVAGQVAQFGSFVVILGIPDGLLGVVWPSMRLGLHRPLADLGLLVVAGTALYLAGGLLGERIRRALGFRGTLLWSIVVGLAALLGWAVAPGWWPVVASIAVLGFAKGVLDAVVNAHLAVDGGVRRLGLLHASWAIGGTLGPVIVATLVAGGRWRVAVAVVAIAAAGLVPFAAAAARRERRRPPTTAPRPPAADREPAGPSQAVSPPPTGAGGTRAGDRRGVGARRVRAGIAATALAFMAYTAAEAIPVSWGATYLEGDRRLSTAGAAVAMAAFWAALTAGRLALALPHRWQPSRVLEVSTWLFLAGAAMLWLLPGRLAVAGLPVAGLGSATIFPLYMALTPTRLGEAATGRAVGVAIAGAAVGGPAAVALSGVLASRAGTGILAPFLLAAAVLMYLAHRLLAATVQARPDTAALAATRAAAP
jgi:fucose permease